MTESKRIIMTKTKAKVPTAKEIKKIIKQKSNKDGKIVRK